MLISRPLVQRSLVCTRFFGRAPFNFHSLVHEWLVKCYRGRLLNPGLPSVQLQGHHAHNCHPEENFWKKKLPLGSGQKTICLCQQNHYTGVKLNTATRCTHLDGHLAGPASAHIRHNRRLLSSPEYPFPSTLSSRPANHASAAKRQQNRETLVYNGFLNQLLHPPFCH